MAAPSPTFDLSNWKLTLPTGTAGDGVAVNVTNPTLATYSDSNFTLTSGLMVMTAPCSGANAATTGGSDGTRCEFFEQFGGVNASWPMQGTYRDLIVCGQFDPTSITGGTSPLQQMIIGQIHGATGTPPLYVAIDYDHVPSRMRLFINGPGFFDVLTGMVPSDFLSYRITVRDNAVFFSAVSGLPAALPTSPQCAFNFTAFTDNQTCFVKCGAYNKTLLSSGSSGSAISKFQTVQLVQAIPAARIYTVSRYSANG